MEYQGAEMRLMPCKPRNRISKGDRLVFAAVQKFAALVATVTKQ